MDNPRSFAIFLASFLLTVSAAAQQPPPRDPQAVQLLQQVFMTMDGSQMSFPADVRVEGTLALPDVPDSVVGTFIAKARGKDISLETVRDGEQTIFRSLSGLGSIRAKGKIKPLPPYNTHGLSLDILPALARWTDFLLGTTSVQMVGRVNLDGIACYLVRVESEDMVDPLYKNDHGKTDVFLEAGTGLLAAIRYWRTQGPFSTDKVEIENRFAQYREFSGLLMPTQIRRYRNGQPILLIHVLSVSLNTGLTDADFRN